MRNRMPLAVESVHEPVRKSYTSLAVIHQTQNYKDEG